MQHVNERNESRLLSFDLYQRVKNKVHNNISKVPLNFLETVT